MLKDILTACNFYSTCCENNFSNYIIWGIDNKERTQKQTLTAQSKIKNKGFPLGLFASKRRLHATAEMW